MHVRFWGVRGSIASPLTSSEIAEKITSALLHAEGVRFGDAQAVHEFVAALPLETRGTYGGNTPCVEVRTKAGDIIILDAGTGLRPLGIELMGEGLAKGQGEVTLLLSHAHWDHVMGFPFFAPAYVPGNTIHICSAHPDVESFMSAHQRAVVFPVQFEKMGATIHCRQLKEKDTICDGRVEVKYIDFDHPNGSYGYRLAADGAVLVYASDAEYKRVDRDLLSKYLDFFRNADMLIFDAQYSVMETFFEKVDWGHSSAAVGVEIAAKARVRNLILFHHDPTSMDADLHQMEEKARQYLPLVPEAWADCHIQAAYEGLELEL